MSLFSNLFLLLLLLLQPLASSSSSFRITMKAPLQSCLAECSLPAHAVHGDHISMAAMQVKMHVEEHDTGHGKEIYSQVDSCYALGDCCANMELPLPALAQVGL